MLKFKKVIFFLIIFLLTTTSVNAASTCSVSEKSELNKEVVNIKVTRELTEKTVTSDELSPSDELGEEDDLTIVLEYFKINITNLSSKFYAVVTNDVNESTYTFRSSDADENGIISFDWDYTIDVTNFTINIYTSEETGCANEIYRTLYITTPRFNKYSFYAICDAIPDYYLCQKYVTFEDNIDTTIFMTRAEAELDRILAIENSEDTDTGDKQDDNLIEDSLSFIKEHKLPFIIGGIVIVVAIGVTTFIIIRKRRRDDI